MKNLWRNLNETEVRLLLDCPGVIEDNLYFSALRAKLNGISEKLLNIRLKRISEFTDLPRIDSDLFDTWENIVNYDIEEHDRPIRKPKKYSGYVRSPSSVGTKRSNQVHPDPEIVEWSSFNEIDYYNALTVGEYIGESLVLFLPDDGPKKVRNGKNARK